MTLLKQLALDGASAGTAITAANTGFLSVTDPSALGTYVGRGVYGTNLSVEFASSSSVASLMEDQTAADFCAFYFYLPSLPTGDEVIAITMNGSTTLGAVGVISTGAVRVYSSLGTTVATTTATLSTATWYRIEWQVITTGQEMRLFTAAGGTAIEIKSGLAVGSALAATKRRFGHPQSAKALGVVDIDQVQMHSAWPALGNTAPVAAFTHSEVGLTTTVDGSTTTDFPGGTITYDWDWGDSTGHGVSVGSSHTYATAGTYTVTLLVTDSFGSTNSTSQSVTVASGTATVDLVHPLTGTSGATVTAAPESFSSMTGTNTYQTGGVSGPTCMRTAAGVNAFGEDATTTSAFVGFFFRIPALATGNTELAEAMNGSTHLAGMEIFLSTTSKVRITSSTGTVVATGTTTLTVNTWYRAEWNVTSTGQTLRLYLGGSASILETLTGAVGSALSPVKWRWGHPVTARSTDTTDMDQITLVSGGWPNMVNTTPTAGIAFSQSALNVSVDGSSSTDSSDGYVATYDWDWGDGTGHGSGVTTSHVYSAAGTYTITLLVTDSLGATNSTTQSVTVSVNVAPTAAFSHAELALSTHVDASASVDPDGSIASYDWDWGDASPHGSGLSPIHIYSTAGTRTVVLTVTDDLGATSSVSHSVTTVASGLAVRVTTVSGDIDAVVRGVIVSGVLVAATVREVVGSGTVDTSVYVDTYGDTY